VCGRVGVVTSARAYDARLQVKVAHRRDDYCAITTRLCELPPAPPGEWRVAPRPVALAGGDNYLVPFIAQLAPPHAVYAELFGGFASVLASKPRAHVDVYNDVNPHIYHLMHCVARRRCLSALVARIMATVPSRDMWRRAVDALWDVKPETDPDPDVAFHYLYAAFNAHNGMVYANPSFRLPTDGRGQSRPTTWRALPRRLEELHRRIKHAVFFNRHWRLLDWLLDLPCAWVYLDPPHHTLADAEYDNYRFYAARWSRDDFEDVIRAVARARARVLLKYTDRGGEVADVARRLGLHGVVVEYATAMKAQKTATEWRAVTTRYTFVANYEIPRGVRPAGYVKKVVEVF